MLVDLQPHRGLRGRRAVPRRLPDSPQLPLRAGASCRRGRSPTTSTSTTTTEAVRHLFSVAAGLDSAVPGEAEILGQVRQAWEIARDEGTAGAVRSTCCSATPSRSASGPAPRPRSPAHVTSVSHAAVDMAAERLGGLAGTQVLVLGAGEMGEGMASFLAGAGVAELVVANRTVARAEALAERSAASPAPRRSGRVPRRPRRPLVGVDLLLTSTGATDPSIMLEHVDPRSGPGRDDAAAHRRHRRAPRRRPQRSAARRRHAARHGRPAPRSPTPAWRLAAARSPRSRRIVDDELERFAALTSAREVAPLVAALRQRAEDVRLAELDRFAARLDGLDARAARGGRGAHQGHRGQAAARPDGPAQGRGRLRPRRPSGRGAPRAVRPRR